MPKPPPGRRPGHPDTRQQIISAAGAVFAANGYSNSSMRGIAERAGVDPALLHHYFGSKEVLFEAVVQPAHAVRARLTAMADRGASAEELLEMLLSSCEDAAVGPAIAAAALSVTDSKAPPHEGQPLHRTTHSSHATPARQHAHDSSTNAQTESEPTLRRSLVAAELLGLVLARYVLRLHPLATAPRALVIRALAPVLTEHLSDYHESR